ncbi:MAG: aldehyde dehydrogenase family protein [Polaromonas sp.]|nr:aldehyde dehydrogenase family protein [Polaromonas sp.]
MTGTLFVNVTPACAFTKKRFFGPVLSCCACHSFVGAVDLINAHGFNSSVSCFSSDGGMAKGVQPTHSSGHGWISSERDSVPMAWHGFGGWKTVVWRQACLRRRGVRFYAKQKSIMRRWPSGIAQVAEFVMPTSRS